MQGAPFDEAEFFAAIAASGARSLLIGRRALVALGIPVGTLDYDFWVHPDDLEPFNRSLAGLGFLPSRPPDEARRTGRYVLENGERVDVLLARSMPMVTGGRVTFDELWQRRQALPYAEGIAIQTPDLDGLIATKRFGARPRDLDDIALLEALKGKRR